ncbi:hypothetical protein mRhiFer1_009959 [Rhinolophus ferrumequinum]|uniref:Uncharacterized protein n=1 Tax=Rhinolophus ferrumequinum TaxID=59479 RepID=A0A7J7YIB7_RHIFE|nr:hypothetical protein mRhiFer1_009959 [Rhinolophus ferrumequinum]
MEKKDGEGAIHLQDLLCCMRSRKLAAPNTLSTFPCVLRSYIPLIPRSPLSPTWPSDDGSVRDKFILRLSPIPPPLRWWELSVKWGGSARGVPGSGEGGGNLPARPPLAGILPVPKFKHPP